MTVNLTTIIGWVFGIITSIGFILTIWQYVSSTHLKKTINDTVFSLYRDSQVIALKALNKANHEEILERAIKIKENIILLDITNRNLNHDKINLLEKKSILTADEANEYKKFCSN